MAFSRTTFKLFDKEVKVTALNLKRSKTFVITVSGTKLLVSLISTKIQETSNSSIKPFVVNFSARMYACAKIPKSKNRKEFTTTEEILLARLVDRSIRPLFPFINEFITLNLVLLDYSFDNNLFEAALLATSIAVLQHLGKDFEIAIPVVLLDGKLKLSFTKNGLTMVDLSSELDLAVVTNTYNLIKENHALYLSCLEKITEQFQTEATTTDVLGGLQAQVLTLKEIAAKRFLENIEDYDSEKFREIMTDLNKEFSVLLEEDKKQFAQLICFEAIREGLKKAISSSSKRITGRASNECRNIRMICFGSNNNGAKMIVKDETVVLVATTVGFVEDGLYEHALESKSFKQLYVHYNFNSFSVGNAERKNMPSRREIGHGALIERALETVALVPEAFSVRVCADVLNSDGSTSVSSAIAASYCLEELGMASGVLLGLTVGLINDELLVDIVEIEDMLSEIDLKLIVKAERSDDQTNHKVSKVCCIQMDTKIPISISRFVEALELGMASIPSIKVTAKRSEPKFHSKELFLTSAQIKALLYNNAKMLKSFSSDNDIKTFLRGNKFYLVASNPSKLQPIIEKILKIE